MDRTPSLSRKIAQKLAVPSDPISLPDSYLLATTRHLDARVVSFDAKILRAAQAERILTYR